MSGSALYDTFARVPLRFDRGKTKLSMKIVDQVTGEDLSKKEGVQPEDAVN